MMRKKLEKGNNLWKTRRRKIIDHQWIKKIRRINHLQDNKRKEEELLLVRIKRKIDLLLVKTANLQLVNKLKIKNQET